MKARFRPLAAVAASAAALFAGIGQVATAASKQLAASAAGGTASLTKKALLTGAALATAATVSTVSSSTGGTLEAASVVSGGSMSGTMVVNEDAAITLLRDVSIDSTVTNVVDMRLGPPIEKVFTGGQALLGIGADNNLYGWGGGWSGQLGNGQTSLVYEPGIVAGGSQWITAAVSNGHGLALRADGALFAAGNNGYGQLGDGTTTQRLSWTPISSGTTWTAISAGSTHTLALRSDGSLWAWGGNTSGQLGLGNTGGTYYSPTRVGTANDWIDVEAGSYYSLARKADGTLWAWGSNSNGQLGLGDSTPRLSPTQVSVGTTYTAVEAASNGNWSFAIKSDGTLWGWGWGPNGVGDGVVAARLSPVQVAPGKTFKEVSTEYQHALAIASDDTLWSWGAAQVGELGQGTNGVAAPTPVQVGTQAGWSSVAAGVWTSFAKRDGVLYSWGDPQGTGQVDAYPGSSVPAALTSGWQPYAAHTPWRLGSADGTRTVWATYRDAGGVTITATDTIVADFTVPAGTLSLNAGTLASNSTTVAVCSAVTNVVDMRVNGGDWHAYAPVEYYKFADGEGTRTVSVEYRDEYARTTVLSDTIVIDSLPPTGTVTVNGGDASTRFNTVLVNSSVDATSMQVPGGAAFTKVSSMGAATIARRSDGTLWAAGVNAYGMLGDSGSATRTRFVPVAQVGGRTWNDVALGGTYALAVASDGTLWGWGQQSYGFGDGSTYRPVPTKISAASDWKRVWASNSTVAVMKTDGSLYMWGNNNDGQLGDGTQTNRTVPVRVGTASDYFKDVSASAWGTMAIKTNGTLWGWGYNGSGNLGLGHKVSPQKTPQQSGTATDWAQIVTDGSSAAAIKTNGTLWTWGGNWSGTLGDGSTVNDRSTPGQVGGFSDWKQVALGNGTVVAVRQNGTVWAWGFNQYGQVGDLSMTNRRTPGQVGGDSDWLSVGSTSQSSYAIKSDGTLWGWGMNTSAGQFGDGTIATTWVYPVRCDFEAYSSSKKVTLPSGNGVKTAALIFKDSAGNVATISAGINLDTTGSPGTVSVNGEAPFTASASVTLTSNVPWAKEVRFTAPVRALSSGSTFTMYLGEDGLIQGTGSNSYGQFGTGGYGFYTSPVPAFGSRGWTDISAGDDYAFALKGTQLWSSGSNYDGTLGDGGTGYYLPTPLVVPGSWRQVTAGSYSAAGIQTDGTLWTWGSNGGGQLGNGGYSPVYSPTKVGTATNWKQVDAGLLTSTLAVREDGSLWAWGSNTYGQLGLGDKATRLTPTRVGVDNDWAKVAQGGGHTIALKADGSLWGWGRNNFGQAGRSDITTEVLTPFRIGIGFGDIDAGNLHSIARKTDGTLWTWGDATTYGQLGQGDTNVRREPTQVGSANDWVLVSAHNNNSTAVKTDGSVWAWGYGGGGALGQGNSANQFSPVMIPPTWGSYVSTRALTVPYAFGPVRVYAQFRDIAGNVVSLYDDIVFDTTPPVTTASGAPSGWSTTTPVTVSLSAFEEYTSVVGTVYSINGSAATTYTVPLVISDIGTTTVTYSSRDLAGNVEPTKTVTVRIDTTAPTTSSNARNTWTPDGTITLDRQDATSGMANTFYQLDGSAITTYTAPLVLADGTHDLAYWSVDIAGNVEPTRVFQPKIDRVSPTSTSSAIPGVWVNSDLDVALSGADDRSGLAGIRYRVDSSPAATSTGSVVIGNGLHVLEWWAVDEAGNREDTQTATVRVDTADPYTTTTADDIWRRTLFPVELNASDAESGMGSTFYTVDGGLETPYAGEFQISKEGTTALEYWSIDSLGNVETHRNQQIRIDYTPPSTTATGVPAGVADRDVLVVLRAQDFASGVASTWYRLNSGETRPYRPDQTAVVVGREGTTTVEFWSVDIAGNTETTQSVTVRLSRPTGPGGSAAGAKNSTCLECHSSPTMSGRPQNFQVAPVNRETACPSCHVGGLALTHPYHHGGGNCGACHPGWGASNLTAMPSAVTTAGAFFAATSKDVDSFTLHVIHASPRWPQNAVTASSACGSCHATAACESCHAGGVDSAHAVHSAQGSPLYPARQPVTLAVSYGVPAGNQAVNTKKTEPRQCSAAECHNTAGIVAAGPTLRENFTHAVMGSTPANTVYKTGYWATHSGSIYTFGQRSAANSTLSSLSIAFTGTRVALVADKAPNLGISRISIDGVPVATVDQYGTTTRNQLELWVSAPLPRGDHTITVSPTGTRNPASTTNYVTVDQFRTWDDPATKDIAPYCTTSCHADRVASHGYADIDHVADVGSTVEPLSNSTCSSCHSMDLLTEHERLGSSPKGNGCLTCHGDPRKTFLSWNQTCQQGGCHQPGTTQAMHGRLPSAHDVTEAQSTSCTRNCHRQSLPSEHGRTHDSRTAVSCVTCHSSTQYSTAARSTAWSKQCDSCHVATHTVAKSGNDVCFDCHGASSAKITQVGGAGAYDRTAGDHSVGYDASAHGSRVVAGNNGGLETGIQCEACHDHDGPGTPTSLRTSDSASVREQLCFECHSRSGSETRTPTPNTWNGRDVAEEFGRVSAHPVAVAVAQSRWEATRTVFAQYTQAEFAVDDLFQTSAVSPIGAQMLWGSYLETPPTSKRVYFQPGWSSALFQFDPERYAWSLDRYLPPNLSYSSGYSGGNTAVSINNKLYIGTNATRSVYTPADGVTNGSWASAASLPDYPSPSADVAIDTGHGKVYYTGHGWNFYAWDIATDTFSVLSISDTVGNQLSLWNESAMAYSPQYDRMFVISNNGYNSPVEGQLFVLDSPSTASGTAVFTNTGIQQARPATQPYAFNRLKRVTKAGNDYLVYLGMNTAGELETQLLSDIGSSVPTTRTIAPYPFTGANPSYNVVMEWDGGDYIYAYGHATPFKRLRIPADPVNDAWSGWETLPAPPTGGYSGAIGFATATPTSYTVDGYFRSGTISAEIQASKAARKWDRLEWSQSTPAGTAIALSVEGWDGFSWVDLPGMSELTGGSVDLSAFNTASYPKLRVKATLASSVDNATPRLLHWVVSENVPLGDDRSVASLTCASCHNSHLVGTGSGPWDPARVSDPINTKAAVASTTGFCLKCHSIYAVNPSLGANSLVPYAMSFSAPGGLFPGWDKGSSQFGFTSSGHYTTSGTKALCENCHDPHGSNSARLTAWTKPATFAGGVDAVRDNTSTAAVEENLCLQCHGNGTRGLQAPGAPDIASTIFSAFGHNLNPTGAHSDTETISSIVTRRHAECVDCHDPHAAQAGTHTEGLSVAGPAIRGAVGVRPTWSTTQMSTPTTLTPVRLGSRGDEPEAYLCFKCHSGTEGMPATEVRSDGSTYTPTDIAAEFNPNNASFHNVLGVGGMKTLFNVGGVDYSWSRPADSQYLKPGWTSDSKLTCTDCHTSGSMAAAKGPHGSSVKFMIDPAYPADYRYASLDFREPDGVWPSGQLICTKCHVFNRTQNLAHGTSTLIQGPTPVHTREYMDSIRCTSCHIKIPHGWKRPRLLAYRTDPEPYRAQSGAYRGELQAISLESRSPNSWNMGDCNGCGIWAHQYGLTAWP